MIIVLDTSAGADLVLKGKHSKKIKTFLDNCDKVTSSELYKAETTNVFRKYVRADLISKNDAVTCITLSQNLIDEYYDLSDFSIECLNEALRLDHSTYDMLYMTLAKRSGGILLTVDKKLSKLASEEGIDTPIFGEQRLTANRHNVASLLSLRQITPLINSEKSMVYFSRNCSSPQGTGVTSYIRETL